MRNRLLRRCLLASLAALLAAPLAQAQAPNWQAAMSFADNINLTATAATADGNVYLVGSFSGTASFGTNSLNSAGAEDLFVAKWNPASASYAWARRVGSAAGSEVANAVAVNGNSVYLAGTFTGATVDFDGQNLTNASSGTADMFVAKLTDDGTSAGFTWARQAGGTRRESVTAMALSGSNVYLIGKYTSPQLVLGGSTLANAGNQPNGELFVTKLTDAGTAGSFTWGQRVGAVANGTYMGPDFPSSQALAVSGSNVYISGAFVGAVAFGATVLNNANGADTYQNMFVAKLADAGATSSFVWAVQNAITGGATADALAVNGAAVYVAGGFYSHNITFGGVSLTNYSTSSVVATNDAYVAKLTDAGSSAGFVWAQRMGGSSSDVVSALVSQGADIYTLGWSVSRPMTFGNAVLTNPGAVGNSDVFVAKLTDLGAGPDVVWAQQGGGPGNEMTATLSMSGGRLFVGANFNQSASFGNYTLAGPATTRNACLAVLAASPLATRTTAGVEAVQLFPNPAHGRATVQLPPAAGPATLTLLDALGRPVRTQPATGAQAELDLTGLAPGLYAVRLHAGATTATQRLQVE